jgi:hypothetical protein
MRRLLITMRDVPATSMAAVSDGWHELRKAVQDAGGRAWRFRNSSNPGVLVEFVEWSDPARPLDNDAVRAALTRLDGIAPGSPGEWQEVRD